MIIYKEFIFEVKLKVSMKLSAILFILLFSSCVKQLTFNDRYIKPVPKDDNKEPVALIIEQKEEAESVFSMSFFLDTFNKEEIRKHIIKKIEQNSDMPIVYFANPTPEKKREILSLYPKTIFITTNISKTYHYTVLFDVYSITDPIPAPQWGNYILTYKIDFYNNQKITDTWQYKIISDFSYLLYPLYRNDSQIKAIKRGVDLFLTKLFKNGRFVKNLKKFPEQELKIDKAYKDTQYLNTEVYISEEPNGRIIQREYKPSDYPIAIDFRDLYGVSIINGYFKNENGNYEKGAKGEGTVKEYRIQFSSYKPVTKYYFSLTSGYYYQNISIKDFGFDTKKLNEGKDGFIPGYVEEKDENGNSIRNSHEDGENIYSIKYESEFSSTYLGAKAGFNLVMGNNSFHYMISPLLYFSIIEARKTTITADKNKYSEWKFPFFGMLGINIETGVFFPRLHFGFKFGLDASYFREYDFSYPIYFSSVVVDEETGIFKAKNINTNRFEVMNKRVFMDFFIRF